MRHSIRDTATGIELAGGDGPDVIEFEGNLYFDPSAVHTDLLEVTDDTYTCSYKGTCNWVDVRDGAKHIAWVYPDPKPGYEQIKGRYAFYRGNRTDTVEVTG